MSNPLMSPEAAERSIWAFFWQIDNSRDRRSAPIRVGPPTPEEFSQEKQEKDTWLGALWEGVQKQVDRFYTTKKRQEIFNAEAARVNEEIRIKNEAAPGRVDPRTGLPVNSGDLATGRSVVSGIDLAMEVILPPEQLAASCTVYLPECPIDWKQADWESDPSNWVALAYKPPAEWTEEEVATVKANGYQIKKVVHRLADEKGYFNLRPINDRDAEMGDLVWEDRAGFSLGFKLTWEGYRRMKEYCDNDPDLKRHIHLLTYAGKDIRDNAPEWVKQEFQQANG